MGVNWLDYGRKWACGRGSFVEGEGTFRELARDLGQKLQRFGVKAPGIWGKSSRDLGQKLQRFGAKASEIRIYSIPIVAQYENETACTENEVFYWHKGISDRKMTFGVKVRLGKRRGKSAQKMNKGLAFCPEIWYNIGL